MKEKLLVSACLLGINCKYSGGNNRLPEAEALAARFELVPVCPEQLGGLPTPRPCAERVGERVINRAGEDVTAAFRLGAERTAEIARSGGVRRALLQERSPSCGSAQIYDGAFTGALVPGKGVTAELLEARGVTVYSGSQAGALLAEGEEDVP